MDQWPTADLGDDEIKNLSRMVVDFARSVGLRDADDDDLLGVVIAAYLAGKKSEQAAWRSVLTPRGIIQ